MEVGIYWTTTTPGTVLGAFAYDTLLNPHYIVWKILLSFYKQGN